MSRPRNAELHVPVTFSLPLSQQTLLREEAVEIFGTEEKYANIIRADIRAGLVSRGKLPRELSPRAAQRGLAWLTAPPIGWKEGER